MQDQNQNTGGQNQSTNTNSDQNQNAYRTEDAFIQSRSSDYFAPSPLTNPFKKFGGTKIVATLLGILLLVGGLVSGTILVQERQLLKEQAAPNLNEGIPNCTSSKCSTMFVQESTKCIAEDAKIVFCCNGDKEIYDGRCTTPNSIKCSSIIPCIDKDYKCNLNSKFCEPLL
jgi:hypothetical protein